MSNRIKVKLYNKTFKEIDMSDFSVIPEELFENAYDSMFDENGNPDPELLKQHLTDAARAALKAYAAEVETIEWKREALSAMMKGLLKQNKMKMPQVAMPTTTRMAPEPSRIATLSFILSLIAASSANDFMV